MNIGIIGYGVVGKAIEYGFKSASNITIYDPLYIKKFSPTIEKVIFDSEIVFVCVPTPMSNVNGDPFDSSVIDEVMEKIETASSQLDSPPIVVIESAVIPSKIKQYIKQYTNIELVVSPEYLTEKEPFEKFLNPECRILGGSSEDTMKVQKAFELYSICEPCKVGYCDAIGAAVIKYMENSFLAMKISFMNQFYDLLKQSGSKTEWNHLAEIFHYDSRMGNSHFIIPGHDGDRHWGGKCFPKDINAIIYDAKKLGCNLTILEEVWNYNLENRKDINWAKIKGAVSES